MMELAVKPQAVSRSASESSGHHDSVISDLLSSTSAAAQAVNGKETALHSPISDTNSRQKMTFFAMANEMHNSSQSDSANDALDTCADFMPPSSGYGTATLSQLKMTDPLRTANLSKLLTDPKNLISDMEEEPNKTLQGLDTELLSNNSSISSKASDKFKKTGALGHFQLSDDQIHSEDQLSIPSPKMFAIQKPLSNSDPTLFPVKKQPVLLGTDPTLVAPIEIPVVQTPKSVVTVTKETEKSPGAQNIVNIVSTQNVSTSEDSSDRSTIGQAASGSEDEPIITVLARNGHHSGSDRSSKASSVCSESSQEKTKYREQLSRFHPGILQQGKLMTGGASSSDSLHNGELSVTQYSLGQKKKFITDNSLKRPSTNVARKKVVEPKLVQTVRSSKSAENVVTRKYDDRMDDRQAPADMATTAALAAASVVAASQPFLQVQNNLDQKITELTEKIAGLMKGEQPPASSNEYNQATEARIKFLENQVENLTNKRLEYLEHIQKQQMYVQDRLVRANEKQQEYIISQSKTSKKPTIIFKEVLSDDRRPLARFSRSDPSLPTHEKSMLETPAPRRKPPSPTSYESERKEETKPQSPPKPHKKEPAFLAQILATPEPSPSRSAILANERKDYPLKSKHSPSRTLNRAKELERSMDNLNEHLKSTVSVGAEVVPSIDIGHHDGPYPLDFYLVDKYEPVPSSPYPDLTSVRTANKSMMPDPKGNAPVVGNYSDAKSTLKHTQALKQYLEGNLESVLRSRGHEVDLFSGKTIFDGAKSEDTRVKKMVDKHIKSMNHEIERDIMSKLLEVNEKYEAKTGRTSRMIPERDNSSQPAAGQKKFKARPAPAHTRSKVMPSKTVKPAPSSPTLKKVTKSSSKIRGPISTHLLNKPFSAEKSKPVLPRHPPAHVVPAPAPKPVPVQMLPYKPSAPKLVPSQGQLIPMAVPLRSPRKNTFPQPPAPTPDVAPVMTSTPVNVDSQTNIPRTPDVKEKSVLPETSPILQPQPSPSAQRGTSPPGHVMNRNQNQFQGNTIDEADESFMTEGGEQPMSRERIEIDGEAPVKEKPKVTLWDEQIREQNQKHLSLVQDRACQWIGQEILAQMTRQLYTQTMPRHDTIPHDQTLDTLMSDEDFSEREQVRHPIKQKPAAQEPTVPKVIVDPGVKVNDDLVNALLKEVLVEKIKSAVVSRPGQDVQEPIHQEVPVATEPDEETAKPSIMDDFMKPPVREEYEISPPTTPELTPRHSPAPPLMRGSPDDHKTVGIYNPTPDVTPAASIADDHREPPVYSSDFESEEEEKVPLKTLNRVALDDSEDTFGGTKQVLSTPEVTPPPSPPSQERVGYVSPPRTPSPSLQQPSPEPPVVKEHEPEPVEELPVDEPVQQAPSSEMEEPSIEEPAPVEEEDPKSVHEDEKPEMKSIGIDPVESLVSPAPASPPPASSTPVQSLTESISSPVSDTTNERVSEGQWLISVLSEGEVPLEDYSDIQELALRKCFAGERVVKRRGSNDDTLMDTDELEPDHENPAEVSEGEFLYKAPPTVNRLTDFPVSPEFKGPKARMIRVGPPQTQNGVQYPAQSADLSLGEVNIGQKLMSQKKSVGEAAGIRSFSRAFATDDSEPQQPSEEKKVSADVSEGEEPPAARPPPQRVTERSASPTQRHVPVSRGGIGGISPTGNRGRPMGGMIMSTGLPRGDRGRMRPGPSGHLPMRGSRTMSPEPKRKSGTLSGELSDMLSSRDSFQATQSDLETRTMTPDQMNVEAILQSRDYYSTTQSDFGSTDFTQLGDEPTESGMTGITEEGVSPSPTPRGVPRQVSVTIPSMMEEDESESVEDVSEYT